MTLAAAVFLRISPPRGARVVADRMISMRLGVDEDANPHRGEMRTVAQRLRDLHGFCSVLITMMPSRVKMIPLFDSKPLLCERLVRRNPA